MAIFTTYGDDPTAALGPFTLNPTGVLPTGQTVVNTTPASSDASSGQQKFNGWANYLTSIFTGTPSGNGTGPGGTNPGATTGGVLSGLNLSDFFTRVAVVILGLIFIAVGLTTLGHDAPVTAVKNAFTK